MTRIHDRDTRSGALMLLTRDLDYIESGPLPEFFSGCAELTRM